MTIDWLLTIVIGSFILLALAFAFLPGEAHSWRNVVMALPLAVINLGAAGLWWTVVLNRRFSYSGLWAAGPVATVCLAIDGLAALVFVFSPLIALRRTQ